MLNKTAISVLYINYNYKKMKHLLNIPSNFTPLFCWDFLKKLYLCNVNN